MSRNPIPYLIALILLSSAGCESDRERSGLPPLEEMNVLFIVIDTLRADDVGRHGSEDGLTPNIDALAAGGVLFQRAVSPSSWTQPAISSLMTGLTPSHHRTLQIRDRLADEFTTIAERFKARGFQTAAVVSHHLVRAKLGYGQGFDFYDESNVVPNDQHSSLGVTRTAMNRLKLMSDEPFFCFVHYFDPHDMYLHHEAFDRTSDYDGKLRDFSMKIADLRARRDEMAPEDFAYLHDLYREEIAYTDLHVGALIRRLEELGLADNTLIVLTADHGEEFGEHDWIGHTRGLYDTLVHVPLIFSMPGRLTPAEVATPVSTLDIAPTLEALSDRPEDEDWDGRSLLHLLAGDTGDAERPIFTEVAFVSPARMDGTPEAEKESFATAISSGDWKLIHDLAEESWRLYALRDDPGETHDLYDDDHEVVRRLRPLLAEWEAGKVETWPLEFGNESLLDEKERERLESLGYIH